MDINARADRTFDVFPLGIMFFGAIGAPFRNGRAEKRDAVVTAIPAGTL